MQKLNNNLLISNLCHYFQCVYALIGLFKNNILYMYLEVFCVTKLNYTYSITFLVQYM